MEEWIDPLDYKALLSAEWNKPKAQNIRHPKDTREARSYARIKELQHKINKGKIS